MVFSRTVKARGDHSEAGRLGRAGPQGAGFAGGGAGSEGTVNEVFQGGGSEQLCEMWLKVK